MVKEKLEVELARIKDVGLKNFLGIIIIRYVKNALSQEEIIGINY